MTDSSDPKHRISLWLQGNNLKCPKCQAPLWGDGFDVIGIRRRARTDEHGRTYPDDHVFASYGGIWVMTV